MGGKERFPRIRRTGLALRAAKFISAPMEKGIELGIPAEDLEAHLEAREKLATELLREAAESLEQTGKLDANFLQRIRELLEK